MIGFSLDPDLRKAMQDTAHTLPSTVLPRRREEFLKLLRLASPDLAFREAHDIGLLKYISPTLAELIDQENGELFFSILAQFQAQDATPSDLFGLLVHAFVRAFLQDEPSAGPRSRDVFEDERLLRWMRDELGMFKFEQALTLKALHVEPLLAKRKDFQRKGERRQRALLTNDAFPMALMFAERDYSLSAEDFLYWNEQYGLLREQNPLASVRHKRRRPRRQRRPQNGGGAEARS